MNHRIAVIDEEEVIGQCRRELPDPPYRLEGFDSMGRAAAAIEADPPDVVLLDTALLRGARSADVERIQSSAPMADLILTGTRESMAISGRAESGLACDSLLKPFHSEELRMRIRSSCESIRLRTELRDLRERMLKDLLPCIETDRGTLLDTGHAVKALAGDSGRSVLILGAAKSVSELMAAGIHSRSPVHRSPLVSLDCSASPRQDLESALFGEHGTSVSGRKSTGQRGLIAEASGGTLFLDEIGELPERTQTRLLKYLDSEDSSSKRPRFISAIRGNVRELLEGELLHGDLYRRLAESTVRVPSLTKRGEVISRIATMLLTHFSEKHGRAVRGFSSEAALYLAGRSWKGGIEELRNSVERGVLLSSGPLVDRNDLFQDDVKALCAKGGLVDPRGGFPPLPREGIDLEALETHLIREAFHQAGGNERKAARLLGMGYYAFRYRRRRLERR